MHTPTLAHPATTWRGELARLVTLAGPIAVGQLGMMMQGVIDTLMVGRLGAEALAGVALGNTVSFGLALLGFGFVSGLDPVLAQPHGAGDQQAVGRAVARGATLVSGLALVLTALHPIAGPMLRLLGQPPEAIDLAAQYAWVVGTTMWPMLMFLLLRGALTARGVVRPAMWVLLGSNVVNLLGNLLFMYGVGSWPGMGAIGVAWSTTVVRWTMLAALLPACAPELAALREHADAAIDRPALRRMARVASPVAVQTALEVWAFHAITLLAGTFGTVAIAAHTICFNAVAVTFMIPLSIASATAARVGNLVGADQPWERAAAVAVGSGVAVMAVSGTLLATFADSVARLYVPDAPDTIALAVTLLPIAAVFQVFDGAQVVLFGALRGAGDTQVPALANVVGYWLIGLPVGWTLSATLGVPGLWWGLALALAIVASLLAVRLTWVSRRGATRLDL